MPKLSSLSRRSRLLPGLLVFWGCGSSATDPATLDSCAVGLFHADCGGQGPAVLACETATGACRWFHGGVVPADHEVSDCPAGDVCCHAPTSDYREWAFASWSPTGPDALRRAQLDLGLLRALGSVVTPEAPSAAIAVVEVAELELSPPVAPQLECDPFPSAALCGGGALSVSSEAVGSDGVPLVVRAHGSTFELVIEVFAAPVSSARIFYLMRAADSLVEQNCAGPLASGGALPATGTLTLDAHSFASPSEAHGILDIEMTGVGHAELRF